ncbi:Chain length determinant protein [Actinopolymorpha singaporensis]|uniref:Chain length determinant protein n=1 Tax=Actinopolymorpha singaporensis TaxID=117157 RepID=A0A1H1LW72_9ACTN|nr:Chain length determinant protein [Actinopolymorpha singaporensis]
MELWGYLRLIRAQWKLLLACVVVTVAVAAIVVLRTTPTYQSTTLFVSLAPGDDSTTSAYQGSLFSQQRARSYADLVRGEAVTTAVVKKLRLPMSAAELSSRISARVLPETILLEIAVTDTDPARARQVATEVAPQPWGDIPLEVLASGPLPPKPSELLQSRAMELLLGDLERRADVVLVDAPPSGRGPRG